MPPPSGSKPTRASAPSTSPGSASTPPSSGASAINLNQLAHAANEGRPVVLNPQMLAAIQGLLRESRTLLAEIKQRLPE